MKHPHLPSSILSLAGQMQAADAFGIRDVPHAFFEFASETLLSKVSFQDGKTIFDPYTLKVTDHTDENHLFYRHPAESLTLLEKERDLSLWERILPYPWGFLKGLHAKFPQLEFALPPSFKDEWNTFFTLLDRIEALLSSAEISAFYLAGHTNSCSLVMRFLRKKCVGLAADPIAVSLHRRQVNGGLNPADLYDQWGTSANFLTLKLNALRKEQTSLSEINAEIKQSIEQPDSLIRYRIPTLEDGVIEMGL